MLLDKEVKNVLGSGRNLTNSGGYLICENCKGYYKLKNNESPNDFSRCDCGGLLEYRENIDNLLKIPQILDVYDDVEINEDINDFDEYEELQQIIDFLRAKATERKKFLEDLCQRLISQEELLNEIRNERFNEINSGNDSVWDILEEKSLDNKINGQKKVISSIMEQENQFLSHIQEKRSKTLSISGEVYPTTLTKISIVALFIIAIGIISIFIFK
ncbi:MAG: hypothetical protein QMD61_04560 [Methanobacterium sp.]|nr:hypothetical protein [Methanobacterium sp.]